MNELETLRCFRVIARWPEGRSIIRIFYAESGELAVSLAREEWGSRFACLGKPSIEAIEIARQLSE